MQSVEPSEPSDKLRRLRSFRCDDLASEESAAKDEHSRQEKNAKVLDRLSHRY
jgi:hypothetical protein